MGVNNEPKKLMTASKIVAGGTWKDPGALKGTPLYGFGFYFAERITKACGRFVPGANIS